MLTVEPTRPWNKSRGAYNLKINASHPARIENSASSRTAKTRGGPGPRGTPGHYEDKGAFEVEGMAPRYQPPDSETDTKLSSMPGSHNKHQTRTNSDVPSTIQSVVGGQHRLC